MTARARLLAAIVTAVALALAAPGAAPATLGGFAPLTQAGGCFVPDPALFPGCSTFTEPNGPTNVVASPDGKSVYALGFTRLQGFSRDNATGLLTPIAVAGGCVIGNGPTPPAPCIAARGWRGGDSGARQQAFGLAMSPDGAFVYVASARFEGPAGAVTIFSRDAGTGALTQLAGLDGCVTDDDLEDADPPEGPCHQADTLASVVSVAVSPDGANLYVGGKEGITVLRRNGGNGFERLALPKGCVDEDGGGGLHNCTDARAMGEHPFADVTVDDIGFVTASPGGDAVYAMTGAITATGGRVESGSSLLAFSRDTTDGSLSQFAAEAGCDTTLPVGGGECQNNTLLAVGAPVASPDSPDPKHLYVANGTNPNRVLAYKLNPTGSLSTPQSCISQEAASGCVAVGGLDGVGAIALATAPDGSQVYTGTGLATRAFNRAADTGVLTPVAVDGCWAVGALTDPPCGRGPAPDAQALAATVLGGDVIGVSTGPVFGGDKGIVVYDRDVAPPLCEDGSRSIGHNETVVLALPCRDGEGDDDAVTIEIVSPPAAGGTLSAVDQGARSVSFFPASGFSGQATFTYKATANGLETATKTFTVDVAAAPQPEPQPTPTPTPAPTPAPLPQPGPTGPLRIVSTISSRFDAARTFTRTRRLVLNDVPAGATVKVTCKPKRRDRRSCPFKTKSFRPSRTGTVVLTRSFSKRRLAVGTTVELRITAPGAIGKVFLLKVRRARVPQQTTSCIPVGSTKAQRRC